MKAILLGLVVLGAGVFGISKLHTNPRTTSVGTDPAGISSGKLQPKRGHEVAAFSGGCFWGAETTYRNIPGVFATAVGYMGGNSVSPNYAEAHKFGHAETVLIEFDPNEVSYEKLLATFWSRPHPTAKNDRDRDDNPTYRSTIWAFDNKQLKSAKASFALQSKKERAKLLTRIEPTKTFYLAEDEHQQYDEKRGLETCNL